MSKLCKLSMYFFQAEDGIRDGTVTGVQTCALPISTMRGSFCVLGPLLAKLKKAKVSLPGGCVIGVRPVDLHLKGIRSLGAKIEIENGYINAQARRLKGAYIYLGGEFGSSVLATANILMRSEE